MSVSQKSHSNNIFLEAFFDFYVTGQLNSQRLADDGRSFNTHRQIARDAIQAAPTNVSGVLHVTDRSADRSPPETTIFGGFSSSRVDQSSLEKSHFLKKGISMSPIKTLVGVIIGLGLCITVVGIPLGLVILAVVALGSIFDSK